jgi:hypothetical protein
LTGIDFIKQIADYKIKEFYDLGYVPAGNNGPYGDKDTPVRNTAHWLVTYCYLFKKFKEPEYKSISKLLAEFLLKEENYGVSGAARIRTDTKLSDTNGLIGQAWTIEGLISAAGLFKDEVYYNKALSVFKAQFFDERLKLWKIVESTGNIDGLDYVFNHQLWFAAAGSQILDYRFDARINEMIKMFLNNYKVSFGVHRSGLIYHLTNYDRTLWAILKFPIKILMGDLQLNHKYKELVYLEKGYHLFNLFGFALIYDRYRKLPIFRSKKFKRALSYGLNPKNILSLYTSKTKFNKYAYPYNSPAFEYPFISEVFLSKADEDFIESLLEVQKSLTFSPKTMEFRNNTADTNTLTARIYELVRYYQICSGTYGVGEINEKK